MVLPSLIAVGQGRLNPAEGKVKSFRLQRLSLWLRYWPGASYGQRSPREAGQPRSRLWGRSLGESPFGTPTSTWADLVSPGPPVSQIPVTNQISVSQEVKHGRQFRDRGPRTK